MLDIIQSLTERYERCPTYVPNSNQASALFLGPHARLMKQAAETVLVFTFDYFSASRTSKARRDGKKKKISQELPFEQ